MVQIELGVVQSTLTQTGTGTVTGNKHLVGEVTLSQPQLNLKRFIRVTNMTGGVDSDETELILLDNGTESRWCFSNSDDVGFLTDSSTQSKYLRSDTTVVESNSFGLRQLNQLLKQVVD